MKIRELAKAFAERHFEHFSTLNKEDVVDLCTPTEVLKEIEVHAPNLNNANVKALREILTTLDNLRGFAEQVAEFVMLKKEEKGMTQAACTSPKKEEKRGSPIEAQRVGCSPLQAHHLMKTKTGEASFRNRETSESRLSPEQGDFFARDASFQFSPKS